MSFCCQDQFAWVCWSRRTIYSISVQKYRSPCQVLQTTQLTEPGPTRRSSRAARAPHSPPPPGPPPLSPDLPPPELDAGSPAEGKEGVETFFFLPVRGGSESRFWAGGGDAQAGRPGLQIRPRGGRSGVSLPGSPMVILRRILRRRRSSPVTPRPRWPDPASRCADPVGWIALVLWWRAGSSRARLFLVVRASDFDDGEASSKFRDYFWR